MTTRRRLAWALCGAGVALVAASIVVFEGAWTPWSPAGADGVAYVVIAGSGVGLGPVERDALCAATAFAGVCTLIVARSAWKRAAWKRGAKA